MGMYLHNPITNERRELSGDDDDDSDSGDDVSSIESWQGLFVDQSSLNHQMRVIRIPYFLSIQRGKMVWGVPTTIIRSMGLHNGRSRPVSMGRKLLLLLPSQARLGPGGQPKQGRRQPRLWNGKVARSLFEYSLCPSLLTTLGICRRGFRRDFRIYILQKPE